MAYIHCSKISFNSRQKIIAAWVILLFLFAAGQVFGADILFITGTRFDDSDAEIQNNLESRGFDITVIQDRQVQVGDALGKDLVIISESVYSRNLNSSMRNLPVPVIVSEPWLYNDMGMTGSNYFIDFGKFTGQSGISIHDSNHKLAAGLSGSVSVSDYQRALGWGVPGDTAIKIASLDNDPAKFPIFAYDRGAQMPGMSAPAKRVGFFLYRKSAAYLTPEGWALFEAAVDWCLAPEPPKVVSIRVASDESWNSFECEDCANLVPPVGEGVLSPWGPACASSSELGPPDDVIAGTDAAFIWPCPEEHRLPGSEPPSEAYFQQTFNIPGDPADVRVKMDYVSVPGQLRLYVNGRLILNGGTRGEGGLLKRSIGIRRYLKQGENDISIYVDNRTAAESWLLLDVRLEIWVQPLEDDRPRDALLVVGRIPARSSDRELKMRMERLGYLVYLTDDDRVEEAATADMDLIVISETVWSASVSNTFTAIEIPVICFESYLYDDLKMTESRPYRDYGNARYQDRIYIDLPGHQMAAGHRDKVKVTTRGRRLGWGIPSKSSNIIASLIGDPAKAAIFSYDAGAPMADGMAAPARRIGMFPHANSASHFTDAAWDLFDAAVQWATRE